MIISIITEEDEGDKDMRFDEIPFHERMCPADRRKAVFREKGYLVWCGSVVKGPDQKYYLFYSRWPEKQMCIRDRYMRKSRKTLSLLLSAVLAAGMLSGCGNQAVQQENAESKTSESSTAVSDSSSEAGGSDVEIELVCGSAVTLPDENFLAEALAEAVGVKSVTMTILGAGTDYQTALTTRLSGGAIPDVF